MNKRLQKKCLVVSASLHLLLVLVLLIGPAFLARSSKTVDLPILDFVPLKTVDALVSGGGSRTGGLPPPPAPPAPTPPAPAPTPPPPAPTPTPEAVKPEAVKPPAPAPESLEVSTKKKREISTTLVTRQFDPKADAKAKADAQAKEDARITTERRRLAAAIGGAASRLSSEMSGGTSIELKGPGGGGVPYANFLQAVKTVYENAWIVPDGVTDDSATTGASVTIARDGTVVSSKITRSSGNAEADRSVQRTLDRVRFAAPLPDDAKENQRTVDINFSVRAKRGMG